jgi:hypothetical protein
MIKIGVIVAIVGVMLLGFLFYTRLAFSGMFDKKYTREELVENFVQHENDFADLVAYFKSHVSKIKEQTIAFGLSKGNRVSLIIYPAVIDPANKIVGGNDLTLNSSQLDSALAALGWTNDNLKKLREKLAKTNCDWICTTRIYGGNPIEMYPNQRGWSSYCYHIFNAPLADSVLQVHGKPLGASEFGKGVFLDFSTAL